MGGGIRMTKLFQLNSEDDNEIDSELAWLSYLHEKIEVAIPTGIECRNRFQDSEHRSCKW